MAVLGSPGSAAELSPPRGAGHDLPSLKYLPGDDEPRWLWLLVPKNPTHGATHWLSKAALVLTALAVVASWVPVAAGHSPNRAPAACLETANFGHRTIDFDANCSSEPDGDSLVRWDWVIAGNSYPDWGPHLSLSFACVGPYNARVTVYDSHGATGTTSKEATATDADQDKDQLVKCREEAQGTLDSKPDTDGDAMNDYVESQWYPFRSRIFCKAGTTTCDYPDPDQRDLFIEVDWYDGHALTTSARAKIVSTFANSPLAVDIKVHVDVGQYGGGGTNLGPNGDVDAFTAWKNRDTSMAQDRIGHFHYVVIACEDPLEPEQAGAAPPGGGDVSVLYDCLLPSTQRDYAQAAVLLHEVGHNILGARHMSHGVEKSSCNRAHEVKNTGLNHFTHMASGHDCDGDTNKDTIFHSTDSADAMYHTLFLGGGTPTYASATWDAIKMELRKVDWSELWTSGCLPVIANDILDSVVPPCTVGAHRDPAAGLSYAPGEPRQQGPTVSAVDTGLVAACLGFRHPRLPDRKS